VDCKHLTHDGDRWWSLVDAVVNLDPTKDGDFFLADLIFIVLTRRILHEVICLDAFDSSVKTSLLAT